MIRQGATDPFDLGCRSDDMMTVAYGAAPEARSVASIGGHLRLWGMGVECDCEPCCQLAILHKLQASGYLGKPIPGTIRWCVVVAMRRPRRGGFMRWLLAASLSKLLVEDDGIVRGSIRRRAYPGIVPAVVHPSRRYSCSAVAPRFASSVGSRKPAVRAAPSIACISCVPRPARRQRR